MVMCPEHPGLTFNLSLVRTEPTYSQPIQQWIFISDFAVRREFTFKNSRICFLIYFSYTLFLINLIFPLRCVTTLACTQ